MRDKGWCLPTVVVNAAGVVIAGVALHAAAPRLALYWIVLMQAFVFAAAVCFGGVMANLWGSNDRSRALLGVCFSWTATGQILGSCVGPLLGVWARIGCILGVPAILIAAVMLRRDWFRRGEIGKTEN